MAAVFVIVGVFKLVCVANVDFVAREVFMAGMTSVSLVLRL